MTMPASTHNKATLIGSLSLLLWSISAVINTELANIPVFEILSLMLSASFLAACVYLTLNQRWHKLKTPPRLWLITILGIYGNDILYITSFKKAPAAHVDLICYLWPIMVVCFASFLPGEKLCWRSLVAACLGLLAMYTLLYHETGQFQWQYTPGYLAALGAAVIWTGYILATRYVGEIPLEMISMACAAGALISWLLHLRIETFVSPSHYQLGLIATMGVGAHLIAYFCWQYGLNHGNYKLLSILSYFTAVLSIGILILFGKAEITIELILAITLITFGTILSRLKPTSVG